MSEQPENSREQMAWRRSENEDAPEEELVDYAETAEEVNAALQAIMEGRAPHVKVPEPEIEEVDEVDYLEEDEEAPQAIYRGPRIETPEFDPIFALMIVGAIGLGTLPFAPSVRYVILWTLLGAVGLLGYSLGNSARLSDTSPRDIRLGVGLGVAIGLPFMIILGASLRTVSERIFDVDDVPLDIMNTWVAMAVIFVMPAVETLYFRGVVQQIHNMIFTTVLATIWSMLIFYPHMDLGGAVGVALSIGLFFAILNFLYSYVRLRSGLAAAWSCQIVAGGLIWFVPRLLF